MVSIAERSSSPTSEGECVTILFGWLGAVDRHLAKYSALWEREIDACTATVRVTAASSDLMLLRKATLRAVGVKALRTAAALLRKRTASTPNQQPRLFVHLFSNGGAFVWREALSAMRESRRGDAEYDDLQLCSAALEGVVFDSAPAYINLKTGVNAIGSALQGKLLLVRLFLQGLFLLFAVLRRVWTLLCCAETLAVEFWSFWEDEKNTLGARTLYIYGQDDHLTDATALDGLAATRGDEHGADVTTLRFVHSGHVQHLRTHTEEYIAELRAFAAEKR